MKIGLFGIGSGICADPGVAKRIAQRAEALGFDSLWTGEHVVLPDPRQAPSPAPPDFAMLHPSTSLAYLAGVTERVKLGTGITLIAQRNPVVLAKEMASLDVVSGGRLLLGIGAGYLHQEFAALGVNFRERGARTDEYVAAMRSLWNDDKPSFKGRFVSFDNIQAMPRPAQEGGPPIIIGGASDAALKRTVDYAQGWYGFALDVAQTAAVPRATPGFWRRWPGDQRDAIGTLGGRCRRPVRRPRRPPADRPHAANRSAHHGGARGDGRADVMRQAVCLASRI